MVAYQMPYTGRRNLSHYSAKSEIALTWTAKCPTQGLDKCSPQICPDSDRLYNEGYVAISRYFPRAAG